MKKLFYATFLTVLIFSAPLFAKAKTWDEVNRQAKEQSTQNQQSLYRNDEYHFRIKFPADWEIMDGDGKHIVKKAVNDAGSTVFIQVRDFASSITKEKFDSLSDHDKSDIQNAELDSFSDEDIEDISSGMIDEILGAFPGSTVLEKNISYVDNRKAIYFKLNQVYRVQDLQVEGVAINYITIHKGKLFQIGGAYPKEEGKEEATIMESLSTFVFEDWDGPVSIINKASTNSDSSSDNLDGQVILSAIIFSIFFTWVLGLTVPLLLRFVFLKRPLSKGLSLLVVSVVFIVQALASLAITNDGHSRISMSLYLVAYVGYLTLRKGT